MKYSALESFVWLLSGEEGNELEESLDKEEEEMVGRINEVEEEQ